MPPDAAQYGIEAKYKRGSRNDYFIVPLGQRAPGLARLGQADPRGDGQGPDATARRSSSPTPSTPYRLLTEVMYTLGQTEFSKFHMMVLQGEKKKGRRAGLPSAGPSPTSTACESTTWCHAAVMER